MKTSWNFGFHKKKKKVDYWDLLGLESKELEMHKQRTVMVESPRHFIRSSFGSKLRFALIFYNNTVTYKTKVCIISIEE